MYMALLVLVLVLLLVLLHSCTDPPVETQLYRPVLPSSHAEDHACALNGHLGR